MFKYTKHNLKKLEGLFQELSYTVRYEKGNFQSGYCLVEDKNVVVINKFYETEGRINCLLDILHQIEVSQEQLSESNVKFFKQLNNLAAAEEEEEEENAEEVNP